MSKHTPWRVAAPRNPEDRTATMRVVDKRGHFVCGAASAYYGSEDCRVHARLIAAAPEMLLALQQAHDALLEVPTSVIDDDIFNAVEHAIEKAKGEDA